MPALVFLLAWSCAAVAVEPAEEFVKGLQGRGLSELALDYLEQLKTSPLADDATRRQIPYLRGVALVEQSRQSADPAARSKLLDDARQELVRFAESNPHSVQGAEAQLQLATVQMSRGQELVAQRAQLPKDAAKALGRDARVLFADARDTLQRAEAIYSAELEKLPPPSSTEARNDTGSRRQEYRARVAQLRFLAAQTQFETAQSYPSEADEFRKLNEAAAQEMSAIYDEFARTLLVGLYARLYEGRCYQAMGSYQLALGCYEEIIGKDNVLPPFRKLIASAIHHKAEVLMAQEKYGAAIDMCRACLKAAHKDEEQLPEFLAVRFRLAEALTKKGDASLANSLEQRKLLGEAREAYRTVAKSPGEYQLAARTAAAGGTANGEKAAKKEAPKNFQAAYESGKDALASYNTAKMALPSAEKNNPPAVPELQSQVAHGKEEARRYFQLATTLVEADTDLKALNEVRYFLCWLYWDSEDYYRAAVLGEFLARRYPDHPAASSAAKIAMASFERLNNQATTGNGKRDAGDFESSRMAQMAELITRRWPGSDDADAAFSVLVSYAIRSGRIEEAEKLLGDASAQSRPRLELQLGNAMWARYLEISQPAQGAAPDDTALAKIKAPAVKYLRSGFDAARKESPVSESVATAALYLAQALLSDGKYAEAVDILEDKQVGPLKLIANGHPTASRPQYAVEAYKAALRAYVSVTPPQEQKAVDTMQSLERIVRSSGADAGKSAEQLNRIYIGMGVALQKQIEELRAAGQAQEAKRVAGAFAKFLDRISAQPGAENWSTRVWLAQTYYTMATEQQPGSQAGSSTAPIKPLNAVSRNYLTKARDSYQQLLKEAANNPKLAPNDTAVLATKMQLGECYRELGQYQQALDMFTDILAEKEASLAVQRAAALTYQERGQREDRKWFENAIHGGYKVKSTNQNRVWGWLKISQVAGRAAKSEAKFRDAFYEARFNIARCRYLAAMKQTGDARQQDLDKAKQGIQSLAQLYPDLGGERWKPQFEQLQKQVDAAVKDGGMKDEKMKDKG